MRNGLLSTCMYKEPKTPDATFVDHLDKLLSIFAPNILMLFHVVTFM